MGGAVGAANRDEVMRVDAVVRHLCPGPFRQPHELAPGEDDAQHVAQELERRNSVRDHAEGDVRFRALLVKRQERNQVQLPLIIVALDPHTEHGQRVAMLERGAPARVAVAAPRAPAIGQSPNHSLLMVEVAR
eukprot:9302135-Pyramimonas_sp.AAC.2